MKYRYHTCAGAPECYLKVVKREKYGASPFFFALCVVSIRNGKARLKKAYVR